MIQKPASPSECLNQHTAIHCSFAITGTYTLETVQKHWNTLNRNYPYCTDYEWIEGVFEQENKVVEARSKVARFFLVKFNESA